MLVHFHNRSQEALPKYFSKLLQTNSTNALDTLLLITHERQFLVCPIAK